MSNEPIPVGQEFVRRLVIGSQAVDRMRLETDCVAKTIMGLLLPTVFHCCDWDSNSDLEPNLAQRYHTQRGNVRVFGFYPPVRINENWRTKWFIVAQRKADEIQWQTECFLTNSPYSEKGWCELVYSTGPQIVRPTIRDIQNIYKDLPEFVDEVCKKFKFLPYHLNPLFEAASYAEKKGWRL